jgi:hypothetical protein
VNTHHYFVLPRGADVDTSRVRILDESGNWVPAPAELFVWVSYPHMLWLWLVNRLHPMLCRKCR